MSTAVFTRALRKFGLHRFADIAHKSMNHIGTLVGQTERMVPNEPPSNLDAGA